MPKVTADLRRGPDYPRSPDSQSRVIFPLWCLQTFHGMTSVPLYDSSYFLI